MDDEMDVDQPYDAVNPAVDNMEIEGWDDVADNISEISGADSDLLELQEDIAKLDASVEAFVSSQRDDGATDGTPKKSRKGRKLGPRKGAKPTPDILFRLSLAREAFEKKEYENAKDALEETIRINAETHEAWTLLSNVFEETDMRKEALHCLIAAAHLQPKNVNVWIHTGLYALEGLDLVEEDSPERTEALEIANMCYSAAVKANPADIEARTGKADVLMMRGYPSYALAQYERALRHRPLNIRTVRNLADCTLDTRTPKKGAEIAKKAYRHIVDHCMSTGTTQAEEGNFEWSDLRIYLEFFTVLEQWQQGAAELKQIARWLLGRKAESYWDGWPDDDREWDLHDDRRMDVPEFEPTKYPHDTYGGGMPIDLRAKLYVYRLKLDLEHEALMHLTLLDPRQESALEDFRDWPDCLKEIGAALLEKERPEQAMSYFELYRRIAEENEAGQVDADLLVYQGRCHLALGEKTAAEECFIAAIEDDEEHIDARYELARLYESEQQQDGREEAFLLVNEALTLEARQGPGKEAKPRKPRVYKKREPKAKKEKPPRPPREPKLRKPKEPKKRAMPRRLIDAEKKRQLELEKTAEVGKKYETMKGLRERVHVGDEEAISAWMDAAGDLVQDFRSNKDFFPWDKYVKFLGYNQENREVANPAFRGNTKLIAMAERLKLILGPADSEHQHSHPNLRARQEYRSIPFNEWLDIFLEVALGLARAGQRRECYVICQAARDSMVFSSKEDTFLIHVAWATCAVYAGDEEACVAIARYFMRDYAPGSDSYRMFAAMSRMCQSAVSWYSSGPAQKFILRQIKLLDNATMGAARSTANNGDPGSEKDKAVMQAPAVAGSTTGEPSLDVCLLTIYGHILFSTTSYTYALSYFARAASLDPDNPLINLSYGLAYVHYALKRQAANRQYLLMQGFGLLFRYYDNRLRHAASAGERQEAHYNLGRVYSLLGLGALAAGYYAKVLDEARGAGRETQGGSGGGGGEQKQEEGDSRQTVGVGIGREDLVIEAALNVRAMCFAMGDLEGVRAVTEEWLVL